MSKEELQRLLDESTKEFQNKNFNKAYEINLQIAKAFPQSLEFKVRPLFNLISMRKFSEAKQIYFEVLESMRQNGCVWKLFEDSKQELLLPIRFKVLYIMGLLQMAHDLKRENNEVSLNLMKEELKDVSLDLIDFYCKAGFYIEGSKFMRESSYTLLNRFLDASELEHYFKQIRNLGVDIPLLQDAINKFHLDQEKNNEMAANFIAGINQDNVQEKLSEMLDFDCYIADLGEYSYHSLCLNKQEKINLESLFGGTSYSDSTKRVIVAYMTIKEVMEQHPFVKARQVKIKELAKLLLEDPSYIQIVIRYGDNNHYLIDEMDIKNKL